MKEGEKMWKHSFILTSFDDQYDEHFKNLE